MEFTMIKTKNLISTTTLLALGICGVSSLYAQQNSTGPWMIRARAVELNWANTQNNGLASTNVSAKNLAIPEFDVSYFFTKNIATELVLTYPQKVDITAAGNPGNLKVLPPSLIVQYHFTDLGPVRPYIGLGMNYTSFSSVNVPGVAATLNKNSTGGVAQLGLDYMLDKNWGVNFDLKYMQIKTDVFVASSNKGQLGLNPVAAAVGVTYRF